MADKTSEGLLSSYLGTSSPERTIVKLEKIDADRAAKLLKAVEVN